MLFQKSGIFQESGMPHDSNSCNNNIGLRYSHSGSNSKGSAHSSGSKDSNHAHFNSNSNNKCRMDANDVNDNKS